MDLYSSVIFQDSCAKGIAVEDYVLYDFGRVKKIFGISDSDIIKIIEKHEGPYFRICRASVFYRGMVDCFLCNNEIRVIKLN